LVGGIGGSPIGDGDIRPFRGKSSRDRRADPAAASGDECPLAFEFPPILLLL
jgi:hypothetical protein